MGTAAIPGRAGLSALPIQYGVGTNHLSEPCQLWLVRGLPPRQARAMKWTFILVTPGGLFVCVGMLEVDAIGLRNLSPRVACKLIEQSMTQRYAWSAW